RWTLVVALSTHVQLLQSTAGPRQVGVVAFQYLSLQRLGEHDVLAEGQPVVSLGATAPAAAAAAN
ncbi:MAG: hypothetical protein ACREOE_15510, partial [Gemmatimonadales bacterium]